jgi:hypothetical protein
MLVAGALREPELLFPDSTKPLGYTKIGERIGSYRDRVRNAHVAYLHRVPRVWQAQWIEAVGDYNQLPLLHREQHVPTLLRRMPWLQWILPNSEWFESRESIWDRQVKEK